MDSPDAYASAGLWLHKPADEMSPAAVLQHTESRESNPQQESIGQSRLHELIEFEGKLSQIQ